MKIFSSGLAGVLLTAALAAAEPPQIQPIPDWVIEEDAMLTVSIEVQDPDSDTFLFWVETDTPSMTVNFDEENLQVHCQPAANWSGRAVVTVGVDDREEARTLTTEEFEILVTPVNDCPRRYTSVPDIILNLVEDQCLELSPATLRAFFRDSDWNFEGDTLDFENLVFSAGTVEATAGGWRLCPAANWNGNASLSLRATDGECAINSSITARVVAVNDCPVQVAEWEPVNGFEDTDLVLTDLLDAFSDVDNDNLNFCIIDDGMNGFSTDWNRSGTLTLHPPAEMSGTWSIYICVTDGTCQLGDELVVTLAPVNDPPALPAAVNLTLDEDGSLIRSFPVSDVDSPDVFVTVSSSAPELTASWNAVSGLHVQPLADWNGAATLTVRACDAPDDGGACSQVLLPVTVNPVNDAPVLAALADTLLAEDGLLTLRPDFTDVDSPSLTVHATSGAAELAVQWLEASGELSLSPAADWFGSTQVTVNVEDEQGAEAQAEFQVLVSAVNDAPVLPAAQALALDEDGSLQLAWPILDVDGPQLDVEVVSNTAGLSAQWLESGELRLLAVDDWNGAAELTLTACDGAPELPACVQQTLAVNVQPVNDGPTISELGPVSLPEDGLLELPVSLEDIDSAELSVEVASSAPELAVLWLDEGALRLTPAADWNGQAQLTLTVNDGAARTLAQAVFTATVLPVNDAPVLPAALPLEMAEDGSLEVEFAPQDVDGPQSNVTLTCDSAAVSLTWLPESGRLRIVPAADWSGEAQIQVTVCDGDAQAELCAGRVLNLTVLPLNDAPVLPELAALEMNEDAALLVDVPVLDVDGPASEWTVSCDQPQVSVAWLPESGRLQIHPEADWNGQALVSLAVCDGDPVTPLCDQLSLALTVHAVNDAPLIDALADQTLPEDSTLSLPVVLHDIDSGELFVTTAIDRAEVNLLWLPEERLLQVTPQADWSGQAQVTITVSDEAARLLAATSFQLTVLPVNDAPVLADPGALLVVEDTPSLVTLDASDVDGPTLAISVLCDTPELQATWLPESGQLELVPAANWTGQAQLTLRACDEHPDTPACAELLVAVTVSAQNDAPWIGEVADQTLSEDSSLQLALELSDVDSQELVLGWSVEPAVLELTWDAQAGQLSLAPVADWHGACTVTLSLDDQTERTVVERSFSVTVSPVNDAPYVRPCVEWTCGVVEDAAGFREQLLAGGLTVDLADVDGDGLELVWFVDGAEVARHAVSAGADTLSCWSLPAPPADLLAGNIVLHAELSDGTVSLNPGGATCAWELDFSGLSGTTPLVLALEPAWPNPFNPSTRLPFVLAAAGPVRLAVYDLRGAQVAVLAEGWRAAGRHEVRWEAGRLASGVYLAVLETGGERRVQRLTLLK
ncbi:MAG: tandem-95 repeat protein [Candidatus Delongbacteria bacterium]